MFSIYIDYPTEAEEEQIAKFTTSSAVPDIHKVLDAREIIELQNAVLPICRSAITS